jgi:CRISPR/Cas system-associated exonuclease Cas4 (RecB family)
VPMYSTYLGVAGRVDLIAEWDGRLSIIDFKTSRKVKKKEWISGYFQQGAAYAVMFEERTGIAIDKIVIAMTVDGESDASVFVEKRDNWVSTLQETIQLYEDRYGIPRS